MSWPPNQQVTRSSTTHADILQIRVVNISWFSVGDLEPTQAHPPITDHYLPRQGLRATTAIPSARELSTGILMSEDRYRGGGIDQQDVGHRGATHETPHPTEMRYATQARRQQEERQGNRSSGENRSHALSPLLDIARYDERHHYGRHSVERRQEDQARRRAEREEATRNRMAEQHERSYRSQQSDSQSRS